MSEFLNCYKQFICACCTNSQNVVRSFKSTCVIHSKEFICTNPQITLSIGEKHPGFLSNVFKHAPPLGHSTRFIVFGVISIGLLFLHVTGSLIRVNCRPIRVNCHRIRVHCHSVRVNCELILEHNWNITGSTAIFPKNRDY